MRVVIAGSRTINDYNLLKQAIKNSGFNITTIISGHARGVDRLAEKYAKENNIPLEIFPANWKKYGKSAGFKRNIEMINNADALIAIWDGKSKGTEHSINFARMKYKRIYIEKQVK